MAFLKRIFLFAIVNMLILVTLSFVFNIVVTAFGLRLGDQSTLWVWYSILGMGGAFINLAMSRVIAKSMMGVQVFDRNTQNPRERRLLEMVYGLAQKAGLSTMPEVGIYESEDLNAFATGPSRSRALVAVSTGLLSRMDEGALEGVLGHEITHIANGDMVTMTLIQGVINTMVLIVARILADLIAGQGDERSRPMTRMFVFYGLQIVLSLFGSIVVCYFSRAREFRADAGGARLAGRAHMVDGLQTLGRFYGLMENVEQKQAISSLQISGKSGNAFMRLFATHPPLEERIQRLQTLSL